MQTATSQPDVDALLYEDTLEHKTLRLVCASVIVSVARGTDRPPDLAVVACVDV